MNQVVVIPSLNPDERLVRLVDALQFRGFSRFIIVDDGSDKGTQRFFQHLEMRGCIVYHHTENRGKGAAIKTALGVLSLLFPDANGYITVDADGQHLPEDVLRVAIDFSNDPDAIVLGTRQLHSQKVPLKSRFGNGFSSLFFRFDTGMRCPDTQTGLRCVPCALIPLARHIEGERYDYEMNFLTQMVKDGVPLRMIPITTIYERDNAGSHFHPLRDSYLIYRSLIRFTLASLSCAAVDLGLFALISSLPLPSAYLLIFMATVIARICSGGLNFYLNRRWSFDSQGAAHIQLGRYITLFIGQMCMSALLVSVFSFIPIPLVVVKILVDSMLFVVSYFVQRNWVFVKDEAEDKGKVKTYEEPVK